MDHDLKYMKICFEPFLQAKNHEDMSDMSDMRWKYQWFVTTTLNFHRIIKYRDLGVS